MPLIVPPVPSAGHEVRDAPLARLPDLRAGARLVSRGIGGVGVLVRLPAARRLAREPVADAVVGALVVRVDVGRADHHLGPVGAQQRALLLALLVGHHEDAPIALHRGRHRQPDAGVAARRLHDHAAGLQQPGALGGLDHRQRDPVLDRSTRVHVLQLHHDAWRQSGSQAIDRHQRGVADGGGHIGQDAASLSQAGPPAAASARGGIRLFASS